MFVELTIPEISNFYQFLCYQVSTEPYDVATGKKRKRRKRNEEGKEKERREKKKWIIIPCRELASDTTCFVDRDSIDPNILLVLINISYSRKKKKSILINITTKGKSTLKKSSAHSYDCIGI